jgi:hypothetical protein
MKKNQTPAVSVVVARVIEEALSKLKVTRCAFKVVLPDDSVQEFDPDNKLNAEPKRKRSPSTYPHGSLTKYFRPMVVGMQVGDVVAVPVGEFDMETLLGALSAWASHTWGRNSHTAAANHKDNTVELLRRN